MAEHINSSVRVVEALGERSNEIGQIVETISSIAGQTNLLALNAAIVIDSAVSDVQNVSVEIASEAQSVSASTEE